MRIQRLGLGGLALSLGLGLWGCSSDDSTGTTGTAGTSTSSGGSSGSGGSGGNQGTSGTQGTGGQETGGSNGGSGGSSAAGSSGAAGSGVTDGGGSSDAKAATDATGAVEAGPFALTSTAYAEGMMIPAVYTCAGANTSPPLAWTGAPAATKSFALVFTDKDNGGAAGFIHWVLWDIPVATTSLPAALAAGMPAGLKGSSFNNNPGYAGPCPNGNPHHYIFELYPMDVATLPNANNNGDRPTLVTAIKAHQVVAPATLTGISNAKRP